MPQNREEEEEDNEGIEEEEDNEDEIAGCDDEATLKKLVVFSSFIPSLVLHVGIPSLMPPPPPRLCVCVCVSLTRGSYSLPWAFLEGCNTPRYK